MNGILPLWKPKGFTSHDCVMKVRKLLKTKKVGHTGTLDPDVEGVLPICIGEATKIIPFLTEKKVYVADVSLGKATTTEDSSGEVIKTKEVDNHLSQHEIADILKQFTGEIVQTPPMYSAVKVEGKKLYEYARKNIEVERPERKITIHELKQVDNPLLKGTLDKFSIKIVCSKGTYIRTLCVDIGKKLGYPAHMSFLERIESDSFTKDETVTFSEIEHALKKSDVNELLHPIVRGLQHLDSVNVDNALMWRVLNGQKLDKQQFYFKTDPFLMMRQNDLLAVYGTHPTSEDEVKPVRVFNVMKSEGEHE